MSRTPTRTILRAALAGAAVAIVPALVEARQTAPRLVAPPLYADGTLSFADLVERVSPAVVSVNTEREITVDDMPDEMERFFRFRFGMPFDEESPFGGQRRQRAQGSGFFIDNEGHIVTNHHVVAEADDVTVTLADGTVLEATLVGSDRGTDLAVLKVEENKSQPFVEFATDVDLRVGDWVIALGNPFGLGGTVTSGIVSAIGRENIAGSSYVDFIQVDAPINRGNSGGPTFDLKGRVVGVNTAIVSPSGGSVGIGFAIPAKTAEMIVAQLIEKGSVTRGLLGVSLEPILTPELALALGLDDAKGALVADVNPGTPAAKAGLEPQDIVVAVDGKKIDDSRDLTQRIGALPPGTRTQVTVLRDGKEKTFAVRLAERPENLGEDEKPASTDDRMMQGLGVRFEAIDEETRRRFRIDGDVRGVVVAGVAQGGPAADARLAPGQVVVEVDGEPVSSPADIERLYKKAEEAGKEAVLLRIRQGAQLGFRALPILK